jgi:superfamily II DNA or RNA helicase
MIEQPKAIISNRIYFRIPDKTYLRFLMESLTYKIERKTQVKSKFKSVEIIKNYKLLPRDIISIPQGRQDLIPENYEIVDKRVFHEVPFPSPKFELRDAQQPVYDEVVDSCFINALVGWGKTFTALYLAKKLGQKTLVVTHTTMLRDQWIEEVRSMYGMEPGIIGSSKFDIEDHAIVIGNVQTVTKRRLELSKEFGTIILDEAHHVPATTFSDIIDSSYARYRIALSGTMLRSDGKHVIFKDYFGPTIIRPPQSHTLNPTIKLIGTGISISREETWVQKLNSLLYDETYQELIAAIALRQINKGHSVLVVASRTEFLKNVKGLIGDTCVLITGEQSGPEGFAERKRLIQQVENREKMCIAASKQIFSEGISVNALSCLILPEPSANLITLEQLIGRIMRLNPGKLDPVVIDMTFSSAAEKKQTNIKKAFYISKGWDMEQL